MRLRLRTTALVVAGGLAMCMVTSACAGASGAGAKTRAASALPAADINAVPYSEVKSGGTLRLAFNNFPSQFNVYQANGLTVASTTIMRSLMPTPFITNAQGNPVADPAYVTSYKVTDPDKAKHIAESVTLNLNPKAVWSNGEPITAHDYVVQWQALNGTNPKFDSVGTTGYADIGSVTQGSNKYQVTYTFSTPFGEWYSLFGTVYPAQYYEAPDGFDNGYLDRIPVTGGPFVVQSIDRAAETITLARNPRFWWREAKLSSIVVDTLSETAAVQALANGELDDYAVSDAADYDKVKDTPGIKARIASSSTWIDLIFNAKNSVLDSQPVRQALEMAVNRQAVIASQMKGLPVTGVEPMGNHILLPQQQGYENESGEYGADDPTGAGKLLTEAGWTVGAGGYRYKDGKRMALTITIPSGSNIGLSIVQLVQAMYKSIGVQTTIQTVNASDYYDDYYANGNYEITLLGWANSPYPISGSYPLYETPAGGSGSQNTGGISSSSVDALFGQALGDADVSQARTLADRADALIWQEGHDLPLYVQPNIEMEKADLANWGAFGLGQPDYTAIGYTS